MGGTYVVALACQAPPSVPLIEANPYVINSTIYGGIECLITACVIAKVRQWRILGRRWQATRARETWTRTEAAWLTLLGKCDELGLMAEVGVYRSEITGVVPRTHHDVRELMSSAAQPLRQFDDALVQFAGEFAARV